MVSRKPIRQKDGGFMVQVPVFREHNFVGYDTVKYWMDGKAVNKQLTQDYLDENFEIGAKFTVGSWRRDGQIIAKVDSIILNCPKTDIDLVTLSDARQQFDRRDKAETLSDFLRMASFFKKT